jgi:hypothetical protein
MRKFDMKILIATLCITLSTVCLAETTYYSDGTSSTSIGDTTYYSNGESAISIGDTTYYSNGESSITFE